MEAETPRAYEFGDYRLDLEERLLVPAVGESVPLTPRVFATLRYLVEHPGRIADKQSLMDAVWPDCVVEENNLAQNISTLRRIFGDRNGTSRYIATVPGRGYRFIPEVRTPGERAAVSEIRLGGRYGSSAIAGAILLMAILAFFWWRHSRPTPPPEKSIAVLPFLNLSDDPANLWFTEGMKDEILTRLAKIGALKVISRTSTEEFATTPHNLREIARRLGVAFLLEGSVQKSGENVRVTVQLIHAPSDTHLWAETYDRRLTDMFQVESEVAQRIAASLEATLTGLEKQALAARPTTDLEAYREYLQGRYFWNKRTREGFETAVGHFERAIELDPAYAEAYVGLADATLFLGALVPVKQAETTEKGRALLQRALELNDTLADAHASLGLLAMNLDWDWAIAEREFTRAIALNPNYATAHQWYGEFLAYMGRSEEAIAEILRAQELDPLSLIINTDVAKVYCLARRFDQAIRQFRAVLKMDPQFNEALALLGVTYSVAGRHEEAIATLSQTNNVEQEAPFLSWLAFAYGRAGRNEEARAALVRLHSMAERVHVSSLWMAVAYTGVGDPDTAFYWLDQVFVQRPSGGGISLKVNPLFDSLRDDPRYDDFLRRAKLPP